MPDAPAHPALRPVEIVQALSGDGTIALRDPSGRSPHIVSVSHGVMYILARLDGTRSLIDIQADYMRRFGRMLFSDELAKLLAQLDEAMLLDGPRFRAHMAQVERRYRESPVRAAIHADGVGDDPRAYFDTLLDHPADAEPRGGGRLLGVIAPHLDYARGRPCYAAAYADLLRHTDATRFVIVGANHFGARRAVVATRKDFATHDGVVPHDGEFMQRIERRLNADLCEGELDHEREHSVELQVHVLRHVLGDRDFRIAPYLCPDPCGPTGTRPSDGRGVDLRDFAAGLGETLRDDPTPTCLIAAADLSHVGEYFQDDTGMDAASLARVEAHDRRLLNSLAAEGPEAFRSAVAATQNATNIFRVGCIYVLATALHGRATATLRRYHQAVTREMRNCVTCAAVDFREE